MNTIIFDTETTGLPTNWSAAVDDLSAWPRIVELAWIVIDENDNEVSSNEFIVKPNNFVIPKRVSDFHKITTEKALLEGKNINLVLDAFENDIKNSHLIVAHNIDYDYPVLNCEFLRSNFKSKISNLAKCCTMKSSVDFCNIKNKNHGKKYPKLRELHFKLFGSYFENAHRALNDAKATCKCYVELKKRNIIG